MVSHSTKLNKTTSKLEHITVPFVANTEAGVDEKWYENCPN